MKTLAELRDPNAPIGEMTFEETFVWNVFDRMRDIRNSFFEIGFRLLEADRNRYYERLFAGAYDNIADLAEGVFGIKKSTAYDLMKIAAEFADPTQRMCLAPRWAKYSQSQLIEISRMCCYDRDKVSSEDTIQDIRTLRKELVGFPSYGHYALKGAKANIEYIRARKAMASVKAESKVEVAAKQLPGQMNVGDVEFVQGPTDEKFQTSGKTELIPEEAIVVDELPQVEENSGRPEKVQEDPSVIIARTSYDGVYASNKELLKEQVLSFFGDRIKFGGIRSFFDLDNKGGGIRVVPSEMARIMAHQYLGSLLNDRALFERTLSSCIEKVLAPGGYEVVSAGRWLRVSTFAVTLAKLLADELEEAIKLPEKPMQGKK